MRDLEYREQRSKEKIQQHESSVETADYVSTSTVASCAFHKIPSICLGIGQDWMERVHSLHVQGPSPLYGLSVGQALQGLTLDAAIS